MGTQQRDFRVQDATEDHIHGITQVMPAAYGLAGAGLWEEPEYVHIGIQSCAKGLSGRERIKVVVFEEQVAGCSFSGLALAADGLTAHTEVGVIHGLAVQDECRRQGIASALLSACEEYLFEEGARIMVAEVRPKATPFFQARGYKLFPGTALHVHTSTGMCTVSQSLFTTCLMAKSAPGYAAVPEIMKSGTVLNIKEAP